MTRTAPARACEAKHQVLRHVVLSGNFLHDANRSQAMPNKLMAVSSRFMASHKRLVLTSARPPRCERSVKRAVLAAVPGDFGCRQIAHFLYNWLLPQWHTLSMLGWLDADGAAVPLTVFLDCSGKAGRGTSLRSAPSFVAAATRVLSALPLVTLGPIKLRKQALTTPSKGPGAYGLPANNGVCIEEALVGSPCATLDEYSGQFIKEHDAGLVAGFRRFRGQLMSAAMQRPITRAGMPPPSLGRSVPPPGGLQVVLVGRRHNRLWLNQREALSAVSGITGVRAAELVHWEGLSLRAQMERSMRADVLMGIDGTGLANGNWMRAGSTVVVLVPYGNKRARPNLSENFRGMWDAVGVHSVFSHATVHETRLPHGGMVERALPSCRRCLFSEQLRSNPKPTQPCEFTSGNVMWCLDSQDTVVSLSRATDLVRAVVRARPRSGGSATTLVPTGQRSIVSSIINRIWIYFTNFS